MLKRWKIKRITKKLKQLQTSRAASQPGADVIKKEVDYYFELAEIYKGLIGNKKMPHAQLMYEECLRAAAGLDNSEANYRFAKAIVESAKCRDQLEREGVFKSPMNQKKMQQLFEEAHAYLIAAINLNHIEAKRLRGLCFINGWGVEADKKTGFELVVASIEQEGAWDRVPQIFTAMGLNKPEFFSAIMQHRKGM